MVYTINGEQLTRRKLVTIDGSQVTTQTGIPLMLNIDLPNVATDGKDVRLAELDGTPMAREIECVDVPNTDSVTIHYPFDTVASTDSQFYVYWGNASLSEPAVDSTYGSEAVWDSNYKAVYHMNNDPNGDVANSIKDSTSNAKHGSPSGSMTTADLVDSDYGKGIEFDGTNDFIDLGNQGYTKPSAFTILFSIYGGASNSYATLFADSSTVNNNPVYWFNAGNVAADKMDLYHRGSASTPVYLDHVLSNGDVFDTSHSGAYTSSSGTYNIYIDSAFDKTGSYTHVNNTYTNSAIGALKRATVSFFYDGIITSIRFLDITCTANYIATTHKNLNNPTASGTTPFYKSISTPQHQRRTLQFIN